MAVRRHGRACPSRRRRRAAARPARAAAASSSKPMSSVPGPAVRAADRLRQRVVRAVRERVAVDDEQRPHAAVTRLRARSIGVRGSEPTDCSSAVIASRSRSVATARLPRQRGEVADLDRRPVRDAQRAEPREALGAGDPRRDERDAGLERDARRAGVPARLVPLAQPLPRAASPRGTSRRRAPRGRARRRSSIASSSRSPRRPGSRRRRGRSSRAGTRRAPTSP